MVVCRVTPGECGYEEECLMVPTKFSDDEKYQMVLIYLLFLTFDA